MNLERDYGQRFLIFSLRLGEVIRDIYFYNTDYITIWISCHFLFILKKCSHRSKAYPSLSQFLAFEKS